MRKKRISNSRSQGARKSNRPLSLHLNRAQKNNSQLHPLTSFLQDDSDANSRLWRLAQQLSKPTFDLNHFRAEILGKLCRVPYSPTRYPDRHKYTFYDRLKHNGALSVFLRKATLQGIRQWLLLRDVLSTDRELECKNLSVERFPLPFHSALTTEFSRHERAIAAILSRYNVEDRCLEEYLSAVDHEKMRQLRTLCCSRWPESRETILGNHRSEHLVAEVGIFRMLKQLFAHDLSERFIRRLTLLLCAPPDANSISEERDEARRKSIARP
jgi:hypothetical protein